MIRIAFGCAEGIDDRLNRSSVAAERAGEQRAGVEGEDLRAREHARAAFYPR